MEIFVTNLNRHCTSKQLRRELRPHLERCGITAFDISVITPRQKPPFAFLTLPTWEHGEYFLDYYGTPAFSGGPGRRHVGQPRVGVNHGARQLQFRQSNKLVANYDVSLIKRLQHENSQPPVVKKAHQGRTFDVSGVEFGLWSLKPRRSYEAPTFDSYFGLDKPGKMHVGKYGMGMRISLGATHGNDYIRHINIDYHNVTSIIVDGGGKHGPVFIVSMTAAPKFYRSALTPLEADALVSAAQMLSSAVPDQYILTDRVRTTFLEGEHELLAPFCFVYKFRLSNPSDVQRLVDLGGKDGVVAIDRMLSTTLQTTELFEVTFTSLLEKISIYSYAVQFQLTVLLSGGYLSPATIRNLLPVVDNILGRKGPEITALIVQAFFDEVRRFADNDPKVYGIVPDEAASSNGYEQPLTEVGLAKLMLQIEARRTSELVRFERQRLENDSLATIYHAIVTPAGCYFDGPKVETLNRVLRKYANYHEYFLRVTFSDEDGDLVSFERGVKLDEIYEKFKRFMNEPSQGVGSISVGGRTFSFLGFSGASLRQQTCWFMAPFTTKEGEYVTASTLIQGLGDFSGIRNPGRCAARIGQAFSNTTSSIAVPDGALQVIEDVVVDDGQGNKRVFSDGCGTLSQSMVEKIWTGNELYESRRPTVFQIRYAGAKGVLSLDSRLKGDVLNLRPSMIKFDALGANDIEICSTTCRPLPMYLNRPLIKILEDLGVPDEVFLDLQRRQVENLRFSATSLHLAPYFLENNNIGSRNLGLPKIIRNLNSLNLSVTWKDDSFLSQAIELALLTVLRDIKYKARIEIPESYTLMGCMDETGYLKENQIFVQIDTDHRRTYDKDELVKGIVTGPVTITRAPALHPGDVQLAEAVSVPLESPLRDLFNCVVFSQHGSRDLPSQLSGGDLDGDLYNIILDPNFRPRKLANPAVYKRVQESSLDRPVQVSDMVNFFVDFMQNDSLGLISTRHLIIADIEPLGTFHPKCIQIAELASVAVDFPKTGVRVNLQELPKPPLARPDFMAPGPRVVLEKNMAAALAPGNDIVMDEDDDDAKDEHAYKYYPSTKVLGKLYRSIDEAKFLQELNLNTSVRQNKLPFIFRYARGAWRHYVNEEDTWLEFVEEAEHIREGYEAQVVELSHNFAPTWHTTLSELEVFIGCIVGKGKQSKRQKELSHSLKSEFERVLRTIHEMIKGDDKDRGEDGEVKVHLTRAERSERTFARALACLKVMAEGRGGEYISFGWIAASLVLPEIGNCAELGLVGKKKVAVANGSNENVNPRMTTTTVVPGPGETGLEASLEAKLNLAARRAGVPV